MRPLSVTIVGWWLIVTSLWGLYLSATAASDPTSVHMASGSPVPLEVSQIFGIVNGFVLAICGIAILKGLHWARLVFLGWSFVGFLFAIFTMGFLVPILFFGPSVGLIMFFLCRPGANYWFGTAR